MNHNFPTVDSFIFSTMQISTVLRPLTQDTCENFPVDAVKAKKMYPNGISQNILAK